MEHESEIKVIPNWIPPELAREFRKRAYGERFNVSGNFPGRRTACNPLLWQMAKARIESTWWPTEYNGAFQLCLSGEQTWVHTDATDYAAVLYLNEEYPLGHGTAFFETESGIRTGEAGNDPPGPYREWKLVEGVFGTLVAYSGRLLHSSTIPGFGNGFHDGRLTVTFFWNTPCLKLS